MAETNNPDKIGWHDDLFGGRDKAYGENGQRIQQSAEDCQSGGEYPHHTFDGENWHYSTDRERNGTHTQETFNKAEVKDDFYNSSDAEPDRSFNLFDVRTWHK